MKGILISIIVANKTTNTKKIVPLPNNNIIFDDNEYVKDIISNSDLINESDIYLMDMEQLNSFANNIQKTNIETVHEFMKSEEYNHIWDLDFYLKNL